MSVTEQTPPSTEFAADPAAWLLRAGPGLSADGRCYLLAHTERGVLWGLVSGAGSAAAALVTSHDLFGARVGLATLDPKLLWELRLFGALGEVHLWRRGAGWAASAIQDGGVRDQAIIVERQVLWGDQAEERRSGFTLLADGSEGLRHAPPIEIPQSAFAPRAKDRPARRPVRLVVRHYLAHDTAGNARIARSRLAGLEVTP
jgi:CRISPR-associated protein (TIGR03984 family)